MKIGHIVDALGSFIGDLLEGASAPEDTTVVLTICPDGFFSPRWDFETESWGEGLSEEEIAVLTFVPEPLPTEVDILGMQMVEKDLQLLELQGMVDFLGNQIVQNDLRLMQIELGGV